MESIHAKSVACALGKLDRAHSSLRFSLRCDCSGLPHLPDRAEAGPRPGNRRSARLHCLVSADTQPPRLLRQNRRPPNGRRMQEITASDLVPRGGSLCGQHYSPVRTWV